MKKDLEMLQKVLERAMNTTFEQIGEKSRELSFFATVEEEAAIQEQLKQAA